MNWEEFFERQKNYSFETNEAGFYESEERVTLEQVYQAFRARLIDELLDASMSRGDDDISALLAQVKYRPTDQAGKSHE